MVVFNTTENQKDEKRANHEVEREEKL